jgi:voltage-gated potassium channel
VALPLGDGPALLAELLAAVKLARLLPGLGLVATVFRREARSLLAGLTVLLVLLVLASGAMYLLERAAQPELFSSIPRTLWWGIVTIASVGYGDMVPATPGGRVLAGAVMLLGIAMFAVPAGILATGFAEELRRRDFIVTWQAVAKVPLFARLGAGRIAEIARLLKPRIALANQALCRRGETADAMYFVLEGEVEVDVRPDPVRLKAGQFFGEIALVQDTTRTATVTAVSECRLLVLAAADFRRLLAEFPDIAAEIARVAEERHPTAASPPSASA